MYKQIYTSMAKFFRRNFSRFL